MKLLGKAIMLLLVLLWCSLVWGEALRVHIPYLCPLVCDEVLEGRRGFVMELLERIYPSSGYPIEFRETTWQRALVRTHEGKNDVLVGIFKMAAHEEETWARLGIRVDIYKGLVYPGEPVYLWNEACFFIRNDSTWRYRDDASFKGVAFGTSLGYSYSTLDIYLGNHPEQNKILAGNNTNRRNFLKLHNKRVDMVVANRHMAGVVLQRMVRAGALPMGSIRFAGCYPGSVSRPSYLAFSAKHPRVEALVWIFDHGVKQLRKSGELAVILGKYQMNDWGDS